MVTGELPLRFEDVTMDGRVRLEGFDGPFAVENGLRARGALVEPGAEVASGRCFLRMELA